MELTIEKYRKPKKEKKNQILVRKTIEKKLIVASELKIRI